MKPIETAPKDTKILLGHWSETFKEWEWICSGEITSKHKHAAWIDIKNAFMLPNKGTFGMPTHWAPMPGEPENQQP